ncbi:MAG: hypothetical protein RI988_2005 [Pseudomonadota bacterium]|jgi:hypothetical protein
MKKPLSPKPFASTLAQRTAGLAAAVVMTLVMLVGVNTLAESDAPHATLAHAPSASKA